MKRNMIWIAVILIVIAIGGLAIYEKDSVIKYVQVKETEYIKIDNLTGKITELKQDILKQLAACETNGVSEPDGYVRMDSNEVFSWGKFQWQRDSIKLYVKQFYGQDINYQRAGLIAWDLDKDIPLDELTLKVLFEDKGKNHKNWLTCGKKIGIEQQITIIKKLEK